MTDLKHALLWCLAIDYAVLLLWAGTFMCAHSWMYQLHLRWFRLTIEQFDSLNWLAIAIFKIAILIFNLAPLIALSLLGTR